MCRPWWIFFFFFWLGEVRERTKHHLVAADEKKTKPRHTCCLFLKRRDTGQTIPKAFWLCSQIKLKRLHSAAKGKEGSALSRKGAEEPNGCCWPEFETLRPPLRVQTGQQTRVPGPIPASLSLLFLPPAASWLWTWHSCWPPSLWSGLLERGSRYRGRHRRKPICLAAENGPGPGVNQQTQHTAHSVHTGTHIHAGSNTAHSVPAKQL